MSFSSQHVQLSHVYIFSNLLYSFRAKSCPKLPERPTSMRRGGWRRLPVSASCRLPPLQVHLSISSLQHRWQSIISGSNGCQFCLIASSYFFLAQAFKTPNHVICNQWSHRSIFLPIDYTPKRGFMIHNFEIMIFAMCQLWWIRINIFKVEKAFYIFRCFQNTARSTSI